MTASTLQGVSGWSLAQFVEKAHTALAADRLDLVHTLANLGLTRFPDAAPLLVALGWAYANSSDLANAEPTFRHALSRDSGSASAHAGLAAVLAARERFVDADRHYLEALRLEADNPHTLFNHGCALLSLRRLEDAVDAFERAIGLDPSLSGAYHNLGVANAQLGYWEGARKACEQALAIDPGSWQVRLLNAMALVAQGDFAAGWDEYEARLQSQQCYAGLANLPQWGGPGDRRRSIAVVPEQGLGTQIMYASCLADLRSHVPACTLGCEPRLISLLRRSLPKVEVVAGGALPALANNGVFDCYSMAGSLPRFFRRSRGSFPGARHLTADPLLRSRWKLRLADLGTGPKIGVSWRGGAHSPDTAHRCTELGDWRPLLSTPNFHWVNLQHDLTPAESAAWRHAGGGRFRQWNDLDLRHDIENVAALVSELDLVISVINSTVHLAGGLGAPTWALVPRGGEWRWLTSGEECLWHSSVRLFRQQRGDDWSHVFARLREELASRGASHAA